MAPWALVSPASRGIGLELARRLLRTTDLPLIATARGDLDEVRERILDGAGAGVDKERLEVLKLDVCGAVLRVARLCMIGIVHGLAVDAWSS